ncbi:unnamed protein product, partial [Musa hybrid cultivar]
LLPRPHAQPTRCLGPSAPCATNTLHAGSAPRPQPPTSCAALAPCAATRCLGPSAPCAANTLDAASAPRPQRPRSSTFRAPARCLDPSAPCAAARLNCSADGAACCPGLMRSQHAASASRHHAQQTRCTLP